MYKQIIRKPVIDKYISFVKNDLFTRRAAIMTLKMMAKSAGYAIAGMLAVIAVIAVIIVQSTPELFMKNAFLPVVFSLVAIVTGYFTYDAIKQSRTK